MEAMDEEMMAAFLVYGLVTPVPSLILLVIMESTARVVQTSRLL